MKKQRINERLPRYIGWLLYAAALVWGLTAVTVLLGGAVQSARGWLAAVCVLCAIGCCVLAWVLTAYTPQHARNGNPEKHRHTAKTQSK